MFAILGLGTGAVYAALGVGLVLEHRVSGVVNFAHGAMAALAAYVFVEVRSSGDLVLPVIGLPARVHLADRPRLWLCLPVALAVAAALALVVHGLVFRPLRSAPVLARVVASVGVLVTLQAVIVLRFGPGNRPVAPVLPAGPLNVAGLVVPRDRLYLAVLVVAATIVLIAASRFTVVGLASRALADNPTATALLGWSVDGLAAAGWLVAGLLAGLAGILAAPITALNPLTYTLLVVPALAAALVGRLSSFGVTLVAGLALGVAQSEVVYLQGRLAWLPRVGLQQGLPLLVIVVVMAVAGRSLPDRGEPAGSGGRVEPAGSGGRVEPAGSGGGVGHRRPPAPHRGRVAVPGAMAVVAAGAALFLLGGELRLGLIQSLIGAVICLSLVLLTGWLGQISLAQMAFAGVAGFALTKLGGLGLPFPLAPVLAAVLAGATGLALALAAGRVRGVNLAVVTLAGAVALEELVFRNPGLTGGFGGSKVPSPSLFGIDLGIGAGSDYPSPVFGLLVLAVVAALAAALVVLRRGPWGQTLLAVRANERAAAAGGVNVVGTKLAAFTASAFVAGVGGVLLGYSQGQLSYASFGVFVSLAFLAVGYVGGIATVSGALVGGALVGGGLLFTFLDERLGAGRYQPLIAGLALVLAAVALPEGLAGAGRRALARARAGRSR